MMMIMMTIIITFLCASKQKPTGIYVIPHVGNTVHIISDIWIPFKVANNTNVSHEMICDKSPGCDELQQTLRECSGET